jgi:hypothetical protein
LRPGSVYFRHLTYIKVMLAFRKRTCVEKFDFAQRFLKLLNGGMERRNLGIS